MTSEQSRYNIITSFPPPLTARLKKNKKLSSNLPEAATATEAVWFDKYHHSMGEEGGIYINWAVWGITGCEPGGQLPCPELNLSRGSERCGFQDGVNFNSSPRCLISTLFPPLFQKEIKYFDLA